MRVVLLAAACWAGSIAAGVAASLAPPMFDISRQCEQASGHNATAMSECVVGESIARSEILRNWDKLADGAVKTCMKAGKAKRHPYGVLAKCLAVADETSPVAAPSTPAK